MSIIELQKWILSLKNGDKLNEREKAISSLILNEIESRLSFLIDVGLEYLTLERLAGSLSAGEAQRIKLASQIGSKLSGVLYVLDEPTVGLHQKDNQKLIRTLKKLKNLGNTVIVVEHDREMISSADFVVDFGPGAGDNGGHIVATGSPAKIASNKNSLTGKYLSGRRKIITINSQPHFDNVNKEVLKLFGCSQYNLKNIDVVFPLKKLVCITGVSGSGKSTLLVETLYKALLSYLNPHYRGSVGRYKRLEGVNNIDKVILIDQSPIGRTPRSNPATYINLFDSIRELFSRTREAKALGFNKSRFSFNLKGGRCETCEGQGQIKIEMQFLNDIWINCDVCQGKRYNASTLEVLYRGNNIADILNMNVAEALEFFHTNLKIINKLKTLEAVGLDYIKLGQSATTLSGGEAQRVKLAKELSKKETGKTLYILDEPTTGLHFYDLEKLIKVLRLLVNKGNSVFIIEHNLEVIKNSDYIIDLGPDGGEAGGEIVACGTKDEVALNKKSYTGRFLR